MGLGRSEQRLLGQIERALHLSDPKLAAALTSFNRRVSHLEMPLRERLRPSRVVQYAPMAMAAFVLFMILISVTVLSRIGPTTGHGDAACGIAWVQGCSSAPAHTAPAATNR
ncbi:MAG TPA: DUF3040 domain-containing protein [Streptosporangiaceae bacterium]|jgi:hypothetical protein